MLIQTNFRGGRVAGDSLRVLVGREDLRQGQTRFIQLEFGVPPDYHAHNDTVATAILDVLGRGHASVELDFPISRRCAEALQAVYRIASIGPVDPNLTPRAPGRHLGLSLSGGVDSTALWALLTQLGVDFKTVTADFGGERERERLGYELIRRDVTCRTNLLGQPFGGGSFYYLAVFGLLFADYLDLYGLTFGNKYEDRSLDDRAFKGGRELQPMPQIRRGEPALAAAAISEVHLLCPLMAPGVSQIVLALAPRLIVPALQSAAEPDSVKYYEKSMLTRWACRRLGIPEPEALLGLPAPRVPSRYGRMPIYDLRALFIARHFGLEAASRAVVGLDRLDLGFLDDLSLEFFGKYNPSYLWLLPDELRNPILDTWHSIGIYPYDERDWQELATMLDFLGKTSIAGQAQAQTQARAQAQAARPAGG